MFIYKGEERNARQYQFEDNLFKRLFSKDPEYILQIFCIHRNIDVKLRNPTTDTFSVWSDSIS